MSGYTGPTGPTGIEGIYGRQGLVGQRGVRGDKGPSAASGFPTMQYQSFYVSGETAVSFGAGVGTRPVFTNAIPVAITIPGMSILTTTTLSVPPGTYNIQALSTGIVMTTALLTTNVLAISDVTSTPTDLVTSFSSARNGMIILDSVVTLPSQTTISVRHYTSNTSDTSLISSGSSWTCFISFMRIQ